MKKQRIRDLFARSIIIGSCIPAAGASGSAYDVPTLAQLLAMNGNDNAPSIIAVGGRLQSPSHGPLANPPHYVAEVIKAHAGLDGSPASRNALIATDATGAGTTTFTPTTTNPGKWQIPIFGVSVHFVPGSTQQGANPTITVAMFTYTGQTITMSCQIQLDPGVPGAVYFFPCVPPGVSNAVGGGVGKPLYCPAAYSPALGAAPLDVAHTVVVTIAGGPISSTVTVNLLTRGNVDIDEFINAYSTGVAEGVLGGLAIAQEVAEGAKNGTITGAGPDPMGDGDGDDAGADPTAGPNAEAGAGVESVLDSVDLKKHTENRIRNIVTAPNVEKARRKTKHVLREWRSHGWRKAAQALVDAFEAEWGEKL